MRIALVCPYDCTVPGGVQSQVLALARALRARGDEVAVIGPAGPGLDGLLDAEALDGASFFGVGRGVPVAVNGSRAPVSPWPAAMKRTISVLDRFGPDLVHVHEPFVPGPALAAVLFAPRPLVGTFHRAGADVAYRAYGHLVGRWAKRLGALTAVSQEASATARVCIAGLHREIELIANGVEVSRLASVEPWPTSAPAVVFVGRHEPRKGLEVLLGAFAGLRVPGCLWVLGEGPETARLRGRFAGDSRIEWVGPVDDHERARRVAGAELFVAPSLGGESFGVVLLEAMAAGTAVVASDLPGYRRAAGGAARLVPPGDATALREAIVEVLSDRPERRVLADKGRARALECDMALTAEAYGGVYAGLLPAGRR